MVGGQFIELREKSSRPSLRDLPRVWPVYPALTRRATFSSSLRDSNPGAALRSPRPYGLPPRRSRAALLSPRPFGTPTQGSHAPTGPNRLFLRDSDPGVTRAATPRARSFATDRAISGSSPAVRRHVNSPVNSGKYYYLSVFFGGNDFHFLGISRRLRKRISRFCIGVRKSRVKPSKIRGRIYDGTGLATYRGRQDHRFYRYPLVRR
jgi:hypothetical protein